MNPFPTAAASCTFPTCPSLAPGHRGLADSTAAHFPQFKAWVMIFNFYLKINLLVSLMHRILAEAKDAFL